MIYVYDILLNFNDEYLLEFYEWKNSDQIDNMKKIKLAKVSNSFFNDIINYRIVVSNSFLSDIYKTCEVYQKTNYEVLDYCVLFTDGDRVIAVEFSKNGNVMCMSKMLLDEEDEVLEVSKNLDVINIDYKRECKNNSNIYFTRDEYKIKKYLTIEANAAFKKKDFNKLRFMYMEIFDKDVLNDDIYSDIIDSMKNSISNNHINLYNLLCLSNKKKQV